MQILSNYPPELILAIIVFIVIPSVVAMSLRAGLYAKLSQKNDIMRKLIHGNQAVTPPKFVNEVITRFKNASYLLDQVNTVAIIEQIYSREKLGKFTYDQIDYFCRLLPNLLLAFGLFGTFLGITWNLSILTQELSSAVQSQSNPVNQEILKSLQRPLTAMSIAFVTSLMGLLFSSILTLFNAWKNTSLLKYQLFSYLEDYLENIYQPQVQGDSRLDKIVNRMVSQQEEFLTNFGKTVRRAVEDSMGTVANQILEGNKKASELAERVYERFLESASTISGAGDKFRLAIDSLEKKSLIFQQAADTFAKSDFPQLLSAATKDLSDTQKNFSKSATTLAKTSDLIQNALLEMKSASQALLQVEKQIETVNQTSLQVLQLESQNQTSLAEIIPQLEQGANSFTSAINQIHLLEAKISQKAESLVVVEESLQKLLAQVNQYTQVMQQEIAAIYNQIGQNHQDFLRSWEGYTNQLGFKVDTLNLDLGYSLKENLVQLRICVENLEQVNREISTLRSFVTTMKNSSLSDN